MRTAQIAVGFLHTDHKAVGFAFLFELGDQFADVFKSGQKVGGFSAVSRGNFRNQAGGYNRFHDNRVFRQFPLFGKGGQHIFRKHCADFVSGHQFIFPVVEYRNADAVTVGVGREQQIRLFGFGKRNRALECLADFGVRIGAGREVAVGEFLFGNNGDVGNSDFF